MARTHSEQLKAQAATAAPSTRAAEPPHTTEERRTVLLEPEHEGDIEALLRALIAIARRLARERQTVVESSEAGELAV